MNIKGLKKRPLVVLFLRWCVGGTLFAAGIIKVLAPVEEFRYALDSYKIFPEFVILPVAYVLPWVEVLVGFYLILGLWTPVMSLIAGGLYLGFIASLGAAILKGVDLQECGCFGSIGFHLRPWQTILSDVILLGFSLYLFFEKRLAQIFGRK